MKFGSKVPSFVPTFLTDVGSKRTASDERVREFFDKTDSEKDGYISYSELKASLNQQTPSFTDRQVNVMMDFIDTNNDGRISYSETSDYFNIQTKFTKD